MTKRLPDWERRLGEYLNDPARQIFSWGPEDNDCALFGIGSVEAITGVHPAPEFLGRYTTREGAALALREIGKGTLIRTMNSLFPRCPTSFAGRGDLVMAEGAIGVCMGAFGVFLHENEGQVRVPRVAFMKAWRV